MAFPKHIQSFIRQFQAHGRSLYPVGGCVRDRLRGDMPHDWDLTTDATPEEMQQILAGNRVLLTGVQHGTVTLVTDEGPLEITTHRVDKGYSDGRHPDRVEFSTDLIADLSRRDFTINAMALLPDETVVDPFDGQNDLKNRVIRCVGDPMLRFEEDALRILRALRFASVLGFSIHPKTAAAIHRLAHRLRDISAERITAEMTKLLCGDGVAAVCREFADVLGFLIPEIPPLVGLEQHSPYHDKDVFEHTLAAVSAAPPAPVLRWAMLLHDVGKAKCFTLDEEGIGHFYGHTAIGAGLCEEILARFRLSREERETVYRLVKYHDLPMPPDDLLLTKRLRRFGLSFAELLWQVQDADRLALAPTVAAKREKEHRQARERLHTLADTATYTLSGLAVGGKEVMALGVPAGPTVGKLLTEGLSAVMEGKIPNEREALLAYLENCIKKRNDR